MKPKHWSVTKPRLDSARKTPFKRALASACLALLAGGVLAQSPLQDLPSTPITAGGTFSFSGAAAFTDLNTGYDADPATPGIQPFEAGYVVKSLSGLSVPTTLNLGTTGGAPSLVDFAANPYYLGLNWNYSPNTSLLAIYNSNVTLNLENIEINQLPSPSVTPSETAFYNRQPGFSPEAGGGMGNINYGLSSSILNLGRLGSDAATYTVNLKDVVYHGYAPPLTRQDHAFLRLEDYPDDPSVWSITDGVHAFGTTFLGTFDGGEYHAPVLAKLTGGAINDITLTGGVLVRQTDNPEAPGIGVGEALVAIQNIETSTSFTLAGNAQVESVNTALGIAGRDAASPPETRDSYATIHLNSGTITREDSSILASTVLVSGQKELDLSVSGGVVKNPLGLSGIRAARNGVSGVAGAGVSFNMVSGEIINGTSAMAASSLNFGLMVEQCLGQIDFNMTGGSIKLADSANFGDAVRLSFNSDAAGMIQVNLLGGSILSGWDDPAVPGSPTNWNTGAFELYQNSSPSQVVIGDQVTGEGPMIDGSHFGFAFTACNSSNTLTMYGGVVKGHDEGSNQVFGMGSINNAEMTYLDLRGGLISVPPVGTNTHAGLWLSGNNTVVIGTGNPLDDDAKMVIEGAQSIVTHGTGSSAPLPVNITLQDGGTLQTLNAGTTVSRIVFGHPSVAMPETVSILGGTVTGPMDAPVSQRKFDMRGGNDVVRLIAARSSNLTLVDLGNGDDTLVLDAAFPRVGLTLRGGGDGTTSVATDGIDTLRLQGAGLNLAESATDDGGFYRGFNNLELAAGATMSVNQTLESAGGASANVSNSLVLERSTPGALNGVLTGPGTQFVDAGGGSDVLTVVNITDMNALKFGPAQTFRNFEVLNIGPGSIWTGSLDVASAGLSSVNLTGGQLDGSLTLTPGDDVFTYQGSSNTDVDGNGGLDTLVLGSATTVAAANIKTGAVSLPLEAEFLNFTHLILEDGASLTGSYLVGAQDNLFAKYGSAVHGAVDLSTGTDMVRLGTSGLHSLALDFAGISGVEQVELSTTQDARNTGNGDDTWQLHADDAVFASIDARGNRVTSSTILGDVLSVPSGQALNGADFGAAARYRSFESLNLAGSFAGTLTLDAGINSITVLAGASFAGGSVIDADAGTDSVSMLGGGTWNSSHFANAEVFTLDAAATDIWQASATDAALTSVDAGNAVDGSDLDVLDLSYATGTVRDNSSNAIVGSTGKYRNFERVVLGNSGDTWQVGATSGVVSMVEPGYVDAGHGIDTLELVGFGSYQAAGLIGPSSTYRGFEKLRINNGVNGLTYLADADNDPSVVESIGTADAILDVRYHKLPTLADNVGDLNSRYRGFDGLLVSGDVRITVSQTLAETGDAGFTLLRSSAGSLAQSIAKNKFVSAGPSLVNKVTLGNVTEVTPADFDSLTGKLRGFEVVELTTGSSLQGDNSGVAALSVILSNGAQVSPAGTGTGHLGFNSLNLSAGGVFVCDVVANSNDVLQTGVLELGGTSKLVFQSAAPEALIHILATYSSKVGTFTEVENLPAGYRLIQGDYMGNQIALVSDFYADFADWAIALGLPVTGSEADFLVDTDGDGRANLDEYLLDGNPLADDMSPNIAAPVGGFSPLVLVTTPGGQVALPDFLSQAVITDPNGIVSALQSPPSGTMIGVGSQEVLLTATDNLGNPGSLTLTVHVVTTPAVIALSSAVYSAQQDDASAVLTLTRSGHLEAASVTLQTADGTPSSVPPFAAALAGTDYTAMNQVVYFASNETSKEVTLILLPQTGKQPNKQLVVQLSEPGAGSILGTQSNATVRILAEDAIKPALRVNTPSATTATLSAVSPYRVAGTVGDANGVDRVEVTLNGSAPMTAELEASSENMNRPWSLLLEPLNGGSNTLVVTAYDLAGNSTTVTRTFDFIRRYPVEVTRNVPGGLASPDLAGSVRLASTSGAFTALSPTKGAATQTAEVVPASPVTLTPRALTGYVFSHWEGLPAGAQLTGAVASFVMPAENVTGITAVFITSPYLGLGAQPLFYGVLSPTGGTGSSHATHGSVTAVRIRSSGLFSGRIVLDGQSYAFTGLAQGDGTVWFKRADKQFHASLILPNGAVMTGRFESGQLIVDITNGSDTLSSTASAVAYSKNQPVPADLLNRARKAGGPVDMGFYTVVLPAKAQSPAKPLAEYPQGTGYANIRLDNKGRFTVAGVLADGTRWTASSMLVGDGTLAPLYVRLPTPGTTTRQMGGSLLGTLNFDTEASDSDATATDLLWFRPAVTEQSGATAVARATQVYTAGWPAGIGVDLIGAKYDHAADAQTNLGLAGPAQLDFSEGKLAEGVSVTNFTVSGNAVIKTPLKDKSFTLSFLQPTGLFRGSFTPDWSASRKPAFTGMQLTKGANKGGWGHFLSNQTGDTDPESGNVTLGSQE